MRWCFERRSAPRFVEVQCCACLGFDLLTCNNVDLRISSCRFVKAQFCAFQGCRFVKVHFCAFQGCQFVKMLFCCISRLSTATWAIVVKIQIGSFAFAWGVGSCRVCLGRSQLRAVSEHKRSGTEMAVQIARPSALSTFWYSFPEIARPSCVRRSPT